MLEQLQHLAQKNKGSTRAELDQICRALKEKQARDSGRLQRLIDQHTNLAAVAQLSGHVRTAVKGPVSELQLASEAIARDLNGNGSRALRGTVRSLKKHVTAIKNQLDLFSFVEGQELTRRRRTIDIASEFTHFEKIMEPMMKEKAVRFNADTPKNEVLRADVRPEHFLRVLYILAENALHGIDGAKRRVISVKACPKGARCVVTFSDSGSGIPEGIRDRVFEPFFSEKQDGQGLGLGVARQLVASYGGQIEVFRSGPTGTHIRFDVPRKPPRVTSHRDQK